MFDNNDKGRDYVHSPSFKMQYFGEIGSDLMPIFLNRSFCAWKRIVAIRAGLSGLVHNLSATAAALGHVLVSEMYFMLLNFLSIVIT